MRTYFFKPIVIMISNILNSKVDFLKVLFYFPNNSNDNLTTNIPLKLLIKQ